jgi:hypothetical protein
MIFDRKSQKLPHTGRGRISVTASDGSDRISATVNDRPIRLKIIGLTLMVFDEKSRKLPQTGSDRISATANDRHVGPKLKWLIFDDF